MTLTAEISITVKPEHFKIADQMRSMMEGKELVLPLRDKLVALIETNAIGDIQMVTGTAPDEMDGAPETNPHEMKLVSLVVIRVADGETAKRNLNKLAKGTALEGALDFESTPLVITDDAQAQEYKSIEIYYDVANIPDGFDDPLSFRNDAMEIIETALIAADEGEWVGAESGAGEVNFGFEVTDFVRAEQVVRAAVKGTPFEGIREITRYDSAAAFNG